MIEMDRKLHDQESSKIFTVWESVLQIFGDKIVKLILHNQLKTYITHHVQKVNLNPTKIWPISDYVGCFYIV